MDFNSSSIFVVNRRLLDIDIMCFTVHSVQGMAYLYEFGSSSTKTRVSKETGILYLHGFTQQNINLSVCCSITDGFHIACNDI